MNINQPADNIVLPGMKAHKVDSQDRLNAHNEHRLKGFGWMPKSVRNHFVAFLGEFVGTFLFLFFAFSGTQVANFVSANESVSTAPIPANLLYVALSFGFSLAVNAWVFFRITGGLFNPAVTLGMCLIGALTWVRGALIFLAQILGAIASAGVVSALFPGPLRVQTGLVPGCSIVRGLFIELFLTAELVFTIFMLAAEKHRGTFIAPVGIGLALFIAELSGVYFTGGSLNPARSFGPAVVAAHFHAYHWIYWLGKRKTKPVFPMAGVVANGFAGPILGSLLAVAFYKLVKTLEYETVNPGQDAAVEEQFREDAGQMDFEMRQHPTIIGNTRTIPPPGPTNMPGTMGNRGPMGSNAFGGKRFGDDSMV